MKHLWVLLFAVWFYSADIYDKGGNKVGVSCGIVETSDKVKAADSFEVAKNKIIKEWNSGNPRSKCVYAQFHEFYRIDR